MKRLYTLSVILAIVLTLTGCSSSGISQEDYDAVVKERDTYKQKVETLAENKYDADVTLAAAKAWAETAFGDNVSVGMCDDYLSVFVETGMPISSQQVQADIKKMIQSATLLKGTFDLYPEECNWTNVYISFLSDTGNAVFTMPFIKKENGFNAGEITINMTNIDTITSGISAGLN